MEINDTLKPYEMDPEIAAYLAEGEDDDDPAETSRIEVSYDDLCEGKYDGRLLEATDVNDITERITGVYHSKWRKDGKGRGLQYYVRVPNRGMVEFIAASGNPDRKLYIVGDEHFHLVTGTPKSGSVVEANKWMNKASDRKTAPRVRGTQTATVPYVSTPAGRVEYDQVTGPLVAPVYIVTNAKLSGEARQLITWDDVQTGKFEGRIVEVGDPYKDQRKTGVLVKSARGWAVSEPGKTETTSFAVSEPIYLIGDDGTAPPIFKVAQREGTCLICEKAAATDCKCGPRPTAEEERLGVVKVLTAGTRITRSGDCFDCGDAADICEDCGECIACTSCASGCTCDHD